MRVSLVQNHGRERWRVTWRALGQTHRRFFPSRKVAETFAATIRQEIKDSGALWSVIPASDRSMLAECWRSAQSKKAGSFAF
jgi:hypothetical protein